MYGPSTHARFFFNLGRELRAAKKQFELGYSIGTVDALFLCIDSGTKLPNWVEDNFAECLREVLSMGAHKNKGSKARPPSAWLADIRHYHRYDALEQSRKLGLKGEAKLLNAESLLSGTSSAGSIQTILNSNKIVRKALKKPDGIARFRYPRSIFVLELFREKSKKSKPG